MYIISNEYERILRWLYDNDCQFTLKYECPQAVILWVCGPDNIIRIFNCAPDEDENESRMEITLNKQRLYYGSDVYEMKKILTVFL